MWKLPVIIIAGLILRLLLLPTKGFPADVDAFTTWMLAIVHVGPHALYTDTSNTTFPAVDYPPGYLYVLWFLGLIDRWLLHGTSDPLTTRMLIKLPAVFADFGVAYGVARIGKALFGQRAVVRTWAIFMIAPMFWLISAIWAQVDSVSTLGLVWTLVAAIERRFIVMWVLFAVAVLLKPQPVVVGPLLFFYQAVVDRKRALLAVGPVCSILTAYLLALPFSPTLRIDQTLIWLAHRYTFGVAKYPNNSSGAFNAFTIVQHFYRPDAQHILGVSERTLGMIIFASLALAICTRATILWLRARTARCSDEILIVASFLMLFTLFVFTTRMHERYLMPAIALTPILMLRGPVTTWMTSFLCIDFVINCAFILHGFHGGDHHPITLTIGHALSLLVVIIYGVLAGPWLFGRIPIEETAPGPAPA